MNSDTTANTSRPPRYSGLSGNEMYCLSLIGYEPGNLLVGNSVFAMGFIGGVGSGLRTIAGGEIKQVTDMIVQGRQLSLSRFAQELQQTGGSGATGVTSELIFHPGNIEFLTVASTLHPTSSADKSAFTSSADGQELFCQWDAGYQPISFVFGNVAYSIGVTQGVIGAFRQLAKGEVTQYSDIFNTTRNTALERIQEEARSNNANSVVGIRTTILPVGTSGVQEMIMIGTASYNEQVQAIADTVGGVTTSDLTAEETWNIAQLGFAPMKLVLGTSVYSLGFIGGVKSILKNFVKGEINELTELIYGAREQSLKKVQEQAEAIGADDVLGIKTYIYNIGSGLIEFLAIGTAVKKVDGITTHSPQLPPQAIIRDKDTFIDTANISYGTNLVTPNS
ncbi:MAG TPA: heavy metal-binding domain-containing protein [Candidatus Saccharimonadales bacterium]|nr:heavy metal-binding domain-containing protein [Candidatus Saccharimonadales bacterium]